MSNGFTSSLSRFNCAEFFMAGVVVHAFYDGDRPNPFTKAVKSPLTVLFLLHGREQSVQTHSKEIAFKLLDEYKGPSPLVVICWDQRNHGARLIDPVRNTSWAQGNDNHGTDMLSIIAASVEELKLLVDYLPTALDLSLFDVKRVVSGVSMGGHVTIRSVAKYPQLWDGAAPIVGCFDLSSLMLNRLHNFGEADLYLKRYKDLRVDPLRYSEALFELVSNDDQLVHDQYISNNVKTLAVFGKDDPLVLPMYSDSFLKAANASMVDTMDPNARFQAIGYDAKHQVVDAMLRDIAYWLATI